MPELNATTLKVLLVEDDEDDYVLTREMLSKLQRPQVALNWVSTYQDALDAMGRNEHDVYLVDYRLGERNGLELLRQAKTSMGWAKPAIMLSGEGGCEIDDQAIRAGASDYLLKTQLSAPVLERSIHYAIERAKGLNSLRELASHDELTALYNRREMECHLREAVNIYQRYGRPMALVMVDVDYFKIINDSYGHQVGDEALRWLAKLIRSTVREVDITARYGGEEFAVILPEVTGAQAYKMAERLRRRVNAKPFTCNINNRRPVEFSISISLGVASLPCDADTSDGLIEAAGQRLYEAKRQGRNRTSPPDLAHAGH